jgi:hypothetical protein
VPVPRKVMLLACWQTRCYQTGDAQGRRFPSEYVLGANMHAAHAHTHTHYNTHTCYVAAMPGGKSAECSLCGLRHVTVTVTVTDNSLRHKKAMFSLM